MNDFGDTVVLRKDDDNDGSDIWDDTALIKAYDKAIKSIRGGASNEESGDTESRHKAGTGSSSKRSRSKKRKHSNQKKTTKKHGWKVGDRCRAIYTEDDYIYDAVIKLIDESQSTCWVTFIGYGNEEEKDLEELMTAGSELESPRRPVNGDFEAGYESVEYPTQGQSPAHSGSEARGHTPSGYRPHGGWYPPQSPFAPPIPAAMPCPPHPMSHSFYAPPPFPQYPGSGFLSQGIGMAGQPFIPPPPPPMPLHPGTMEGQDEALHAMLMSWYMSGYHTGYYKGLKEGKTASHSAATTPDRRTPRRRPHSQNRGMQSR